jgi:hypothetical protein
MKTSQQPDTEAAAGHESQVPKGGDSVDCLVGHLCHVCKQPRPAISLMLCDACLGAEKIEQLHSGEYREEDWDEK